MKQLLRRIRGAVVVGLTWAVAWGFVGGLMELVDPRGRIADIWPMVLAIPGFFAGVIFSLVVMTAERRRSFHELSLARFGIWGAVTGALLGGLGVAVLSLGTLVLVPLSLLGAISASGSLALARKGESGERLGRGDDQARSASD